MLRNALTSCFTDAPFFSFLFVYGLVAFFFSPSERMLKDLFVHNFNLHAHIQRFSLGQGRGNGITALPVVGVLGLQTAMTNCSLFTALENIMDHFCNFSCKCTSAVSQDSA